MRMWISIGVTAFALLLPTSVDAASSCWKAEEHQRSANQRLSQYREIWRSGCRQSLIRPGRQCSSDLYLIKQTHRVLENMRAKGEIEASEKLDLACGTQLADTFRQQLEVIDEILNDPPPADDALAVVENNAAFRDQMLNLQNRNSAAIAAANAQLRELCRRNKSAALEGLCQNKSDARIKQPSTPQPNTSNDQIREEIISNVIESCYYEVIDQSTLPTNMTVEDQIAGMKKIAVNDVENIVRDLRPFARPDMSVGQRMKVYEGAKDVCIKHARISMAAE